MLKGVIGNGVIKPAASVPTGTFEITFAKGPGAPINNPPFVFITFLSDADIVWTKPDTVSTFTGKAPSETNFDQTGVYTVVASDWSRVISFTGSNVGGDYSVDALVSSAATALTEINVSLNTSMVDVDISPNTLLTSVVFFSEALLDSELDDILVALDTNGLSDGVVVITSNPGTPTAVGVAAGVSLTSKGWTVVY